MEFLGRRVAMTAKAVRALAEDRMAAAGSSLSVAIIIRILSLDPDLSQRELARRMGIEGPTLVRHLDRLEQDGIVTRTRASDDRRVVRVRVTEAGEVLNEHLGAVSADTHRELAAVFSPAELHQFEGYLDRIRAHAADRLQAGTTDREVTNA